MRTSVAPQIERQRVPANAARCMLPESIVSISLRVDICRISSSNGYFFWVHSSVLKNNKVYGWGTVVSKYNDQLYRVKIFDDEFDCKAIYMGIKEF